MKPLFGHPVSKYRLRLCIQLLHIDQLLVLFVCITFILTLWGQEGPSWEVESIYGHIFAILFHNLTIYMFSQRISNADTN